jgi:hypothetical protein
MKKLAIAVLALSMSAVSADAMVRHHMMHSAAMMRHHMMNAHVGMCSAGQVSARCMCGAKGAKLQACNVGQWCHPERAACTQ